MIDESFHWKSDLLKQADRLKRRTTQKCWPDASLAPCEQAIMPGFYLIRKLTESAKLTYKVAKMSVSVCSYPSTGRTVHLLNSHRPEKLYHRDKPKKASAALPFRAIRSFTATCFHC